MSCATSFAIFGETDLADHAPPCRGIASLAFPPKMLAIAARAIARARADQWLFEGGDKALRQSVKRPIGHAYHDIASSRIGHYPFEDRVG